MTFQSKYIFYRKNISNISYDVNKQIVIGNATGQDEFLNSSIENFKIYNVALTDAQIAAMGAATDEAPPPPQEVRVEIHDSLSGQEISVLAGLGYQIIPDGMRLRLYVDGTEVTVQEYEYGF